MAHGALGGRRRPRRAERLTEDDLKVTATLKEGELDHRGGALPLVCRTASLLRLPRYIEFRANCPEARSGASSSASCGTRA